MAYTPIVVDHMDVAAADAAMRDGDLHLVGFDFPRIVLVRQQFSASSMRGESLKGWHKSVALGSEIENQGPRKSTLFDFYGYDLHATQHGFYRD